MDILPPTSGIYSILNTSNLRLYVGSSFNMRRRMVAHLRDLRRGSHSNRALQYDWNEYGEVVFRADVLELVLDANTLTEIEEGWIARFDNRVYNLQFSASGQATAVNFPEHLVYKPLTEEQYATARNWLLQGKSANFLYRYFGGSRAKRMAEFAAIRASIKDAA
jgi:group I intron endonuclease